MQEIRGLLKRRWRDAEREQLRTLLRTMVLQFHGLMLELFQLLDRFHRGHRSNVERL